MDSAGIIDFEIVNSLNYSIKNNIEKI